MFLTTSDNKKIAYDFYPAENPKGYLLLVHMMPATKESWKEFAKEMQKAGYASLAIDLRGHGESEGGPFEFRQFSDAEHQKSILDVAAAVDFLKDQGAPPEKIYLIGASIGANLVLQYLASHPEIKNAILLSAGLNYRGILTVPLAKKLMAGQKVLLFSSRDDVRSGPDNPSDNEKLLAEIPLGVQKDLIIYDRGGHGTDFLSQATRDIRRYLLENF